MVGCFGAWALRWLGGLDGWAHGCFLCLASARLFMFFFGGGKA